MIFVNFYFYDHIFEVKLLKILYFVVLQAITLSANGWCDSGHGINHIYDLLFMMGRDDIPVGVGGEGGILPNGTILPDVGGYLPIIDQVRLTCFFFCSNFIQIKVKKEKKRKEKTKTKTKAKCISRRELSFVWYLFF